MSHPILSNKSVRELMMKKVHLMAKRVYSPVFDQADFEQYLQTELLAAANGYDPVQGTLTPYASTVLHRATLRFFRDQRAQKRSGSRKQLPLAFQVDPRTERGQELVDLRLSVEAVLLTLTPAQQELVRRLMELSPSELARERNIPRSTLQAQLRVLRKPLERANLKEFL